MVIYVRIYYLDYFVMSTDKWEWEIKNYAQIMNFTEIFYIQRHIRTVLPLSKASSLNCNIATTTWNKSWDLNS